MKLFNKTIALLITLALFAGMFWGLFLLAKYLILQYLTLESPWNTIVLLITLTLLICSYWISKAIRKSSVLNKQTKALPELDPQKIKTYGEFIKQYFTQEENIHEEEHTPLNWLETLQNPQNQNHHPVVSNLSKQINPGMLMWSSPQVLTEYLKLQSLIQSRTADQHQIWEQSVQVLWEIRKELGSNNEGLEINQLRFLFPD